MRDACYQENIMSAGVASFAERLRCAHAPPIDADKQKQPDDIDEMPVPGGSFEAEVMVRPEMPLPRPPKADGQERGADDHMEAVKPGRHEEGRWIDAVAEMECGVAVFVGLHRGKAEAEDHGHGQ